MSNYIHEHDGWPAVRWRGDALSGALALARLSQGRLIGRMEALGFRGRDEALLGTLTTDVIKSSEIEGEHLDSEQVRSSVARRLGLDIGGLKPADRHVDGVVRMTLDATQRYAEPLTAERLCEWHAWLFPTGRSGHHRITVGAWRSEASDPMQVVSGPIGRARVHFEAPAAARLDDEMARFLAWFNTDVTTEPVLKAAQAHFWLVTIHPFEDGNGRLARAVSDMALARSEQSAQRFYSMSAQIRDERDDYYRMLESSQRGPLDITPWISWFLGCLHRAVERSLGSLGPSLAKARLFDRLREAPVNTRQQLVLARLVDGFEGRLTTSKWAALTGASHDTALRDIQQLIDRGVLVKNEAGGRSSSYSLAESINS